MINYRKIINLTIAFMFIIIATNTVSSAAITINKSGGIVTAEHDNGIVIYQGTDDIEAIETAINEIDSGTIFFESGEYEIDRTVYLKSNLAFVGVGDVIFHCFNGMAFKTGDSGYSSSTILLANNVGSTDTNIKLQSIEGLNINDYVKLYDDALVDGFKNGEIVEIIAMDDKTITIDRPLYDSYSTIRNASIRKISMFENITFENIDFNGYGIETDSVGIYFYGANNCRIYNCEFKNFGIRAVGLWDCINCMVINNTFKDNFYTGMGYSVCLVNACDNITIINNSFLENGRHYIATGAGTGTLISDGLCRKVYIINNNFSDSADEAVNTHAGGRVKVEVIGNTFTRCAKGIEFSNTDSIITNNIFINCVSAIETYQNGIHIIEGNFFHDNKISCKIEATSIIMGNKFDNGGYISDSIIHTADYVEANRYIIIDNNTFINNDDAVIYFEGWDDLYTRNITISNNKCTLVGTNPIMKIINCRDVRLISNNLEGCVEFQKCDDIIIYNNYIISQNTGLRICNAKGTHLILSNKLKCVSRGLSLENTDCDPITDKIIINKYNKVNAPTPIYNDGYSNVIIIDSYEKVVNNAPVLNSIGAKYVDELSTFTFAVEATDEDGGLYYTDFS